MDQRMNDYLGAWNKNFIASRSSKIIDCAFVIWSDMSTFKLLYLNFKHFFKILKTLNGISLFISGTWEVTQLWSYRSRDFEIGTCRQHRFFILLRWVRPWIVFNFKIILKRKHFFFTSREQKQPPEMFYNKRCS